MVHNKCSKYKEDQFYGILSYFITCTLNTTYYRLQLRSISKVSEGTTWIRSAQNAECYYDSQCKMHLLCEQKIVGQDLVIPKGNIPCKVGHIFWF